MKHEPRAHCSPIRSGWTNDDGSILFGPLFFLAETVQQPRRGNFSFPFRSSRFPQPANQPEHWFCCCFLLFPSLFHVLLHCHSRCPRLALIRISPEHRTRFATQPIHVCAPRQKSILQQSRPQQTPGRNERMVVVVLLVVDCDWNRFQKGDRTKFAGSNPICFKADTLRFPLDCLLNANARQWIKKCEPWGRYRLGVCVV